MPTYLPTLRSVAQRKFATIRECAIALLLVEHTVDDDGRKVGLDYDVIREFIKKKFPVITYNGPHKGKPMRMSFKKLRWIATELNREGARLPVRPRVKKKNSKVKS